MYSVSDNVIELFKNGNRQLIRITFTNGDTSLSITESNVVSGGLTIDRYCISGSKLELGSAIAAQMTLKLRNYDGEYNDVVFEGGEFSVEIGIQDWEDESTEPVYIPMGVFIADESPRKQSVINITALDKMVLLDTIVNWDNFAFPMSVTEIVNQVCTDCGVTLGKSISALSNSSYSVTSYPSSNDITYRTLVQWCAFLLGTCAQMDYNGELVFRWYEQTGVSITPAERFSSDLYENDISVTDICYTSNSSVVYHTGEDTSYSITFSGNELLQEDIQDALDNIHPVIDGYTYRPYEAVIYSAPFLWPLDEISYTDAQGVVHNTVITHITYTCNQNTTIAGKGETTTSESYDYTGVLEGSSLGVVVKSLIEKTETSILLEVSEIQKDVNEKIATLALTSDSIALSVSALNNATGVTYQNYALTSGDYTEDSDLSNWFVYPTSRADYVSIAAHEGYVRIMKVSSIKGINDACLLLSDAFVVESGVEYTYTIKYRTNDDISVGVALGTLYDGVTDETILIENDIADGSQVNNWVVYSGTFTPYDLVDSDGDNYSICLILPTNAEDGNYIDVAYIMLEKGSTAHDWEAAPEDNKLTTSADLALTIGEDGIARLSASADSIELTAGQLIITSGNFTLDADGNAEFSGNISGSNISSSTFTTVNGNNKTSIFGGRTVVYYDDEMTGALLSTYYSETRGVTLATFGSYLTLGYGLDSDDDSLPTGIAYLLNNGLNPSDHTERHIFYGKIYSAGDFYIGKNRRVCMYTSDDSLATLIKLDTADALVIGDTTSMTDIYLKTAGKVYLDGTLSVRDITDRNFSSVTYTEFDGDVISSGSLTVTKKLGWCNVHGVASMTEELSSWVQILDSTVVPAPQDGRVRYMTVSSWSASYTRPARIRINAAGGLCINRGGTFEVDFSIVYPIE